MRYLDTIDADAEWRMGTKEIKMTGKSGYVWKILDHFTIFMTALHISFVFVRLCGYIQRKSQENSLFCDANIGKLDPTNYGIFPKIKP